MSAVTKVDAIQLRSIIKALEEIRSAVKDLDLPDDPATETTLASCLTALGNILVAVESPALPDGAATEETLADILDQVDIKLSEQLEGITGAAPNNKTLYDLDDALQDILTQVGLIAIDTGRIPTSPATEGGNLASIKTNTDKIPASPATEGGNLASIKTNTDKIPASPATEGGNLASIKTNTDKIPSSPATDRTTAAAPFAVRASDGSNFIDPRIIRDASGYNPSFVQAGDTAGRGIQGFVTFTAYPGAVATGKVQPILCTRNGVQMIVFEEQNAVVQSYAFYFATPTAGIAVASGTSVDILAIAAQTTRLPYITRVIVHAKGDQVLFEASMAPTYKGGSSITGAYRYGQGATSPDALVVYSPTVTTQGTVAFRKLVDDWSDELWNPNVICMGYNGKVINIRAVSQTSGGSGSTVWCEVELYEVKVAA